ncbi:hypothetical protein FVER14953_21007 [Fusarium verticillioides]|nr:hypothetical protein FVER14953_21007 [Fusarium verticillioides]
MLQANGIERWTSALSRGQHGYPMVFLGTQMLLKVLYNNIKDK